MSRDAGGVVVGVVTDVEDPEGEGRVEVNFPWLDEDTRSMWAPVAAPMAGPGRGAFFMPERGDEVLLAFEHNDFDHPYVIGFLWNGEDAPPSEDVRQRIIRSVNGHTIRFVDSTPGSGGSGALVIEDANNNRITMSNGKISIKSVAVLELEAPTIILKGPGYMRLITPNSNPI